MKVQVPKSLLEGFDANATGLPERTFIYSALPFNMEEVDMETSSFREEAVAGGHCVCHSKVSAPFGKAAPYVKRLYGKNTVLFTYSGDFFSLKNDWTQGSYGNVFHYFEDIGALIHVSFACEPYWQGNTRLSMLRMSIFKLSMETDFKRGRELYGHVQYSIPESGIPYEQNYQLRGGVELLNICRTFVPLFAMQLGYRQPMTQRESSEWGKTVVNYVHSHNPGSSTVSYHAIAKDVTVVPFEPRMAFALEEPTILLDKLPVANNKYFVNAAMQSAYIEALERVPTMSDNNISNIMELVTFVYNIVVNHRIEIPKSLQDGWLTYRYVYNTTKSDVEEAVAYVHRSMNLGDLGKGFSCHGESVFTFKGKDITLRCGLSAYEKDLNAFLDAWTSLYKYGLQPNFYTLWDLVPYSFIVDWLLPIGDTLSAYELIKNTSNRYRLTSPWWSMKYTNMYQGIPYTVYSRWRDEPPALNGFYFFESNSGSSKRTICRILDVAALTIK